MIKLSLNNTCCAVCASGRRLTRWLWLTPLLLLSGTLLLAGCGRKPGPARASGPKAGAAQPSNQTEMAAPAQPAAESAQGVFNARLNEALAKAPQFDRDGALRQIVKTRFTMDWDRLFPEGYQQDKLLTEKEVEIKAQQELAAAADKAFSSERQREVEAQAMEKYPLFKVGDEITVILVNQRQVSGQIMKIDPTNIKIGTYTLLLRDIVSPHASAFNPTENAGLRRVYFNQHFGIPREDYINANAKAIRDTTYRRSGYLPQAGKWVRIDTLLVTEIEPELDRLAAEFQRQQESQLRYTVREQMRQEGFPVDQIPADNAPSTPVAAPL